MEPRPEETRNGSERQRDAIRRITAAGNARLSREDLARQVLHAIAEAVEAGGGSLLLHDAANARLVFQAVLGPAAAMLTGQSIRDDEGMAGRVFQSGQAQSMSQGTGGRQRSLATLPLKSPSGATVGVIQLADTPSGVFEATDMALLEALAGLAGAALETAERREGERFRHLAQQLLASVHEGDAGARPSAGSRDETLALQHQRDAEREKQARMEQELAIGRRIQMSLLPPRRFHREQFEILSRSEPASEVGGDFYNLFEVRDHAWLGRWSRSPGARLGIVLGDVAGKGVGAALFMAVTTTLIQAQGQLLPSPAATLAAANAELYPKMRPPGGQPLFATAVYGVLDLASGEIRLASAGQTPPIYWPAGDAPRYLRLRGLPLGALPTPNYDETVLHLAPGDRLLFCSDGFIEDRDADGRVVGYARFLERLAALTARAGHEVVEALFDASEARVAASETDPGADDRTLVLITAAVGG